MSGIDFAALDGSLLFEELGERTILRSLDECLGVGERTAGLLRAYVAAERRRDLSFRVGEARILAAILCEGPRA